MPSKIKGECVNKNEHNCGGSNSYQVKDLEKAGFADITEITRQNKCKNLVRLNSDFGDKCNIKVDEIAHTTIKRIRLRPIVSTLEGADSKFFDSQGNEWKAYDIYLDQSSVQSLEAGKEIEINGIIIPDPRSQKISLIASKAIEKETRNYDMGKIHALRALFQSMSIDEIMTWIKTEFEKYAKIIKRGNVILGVIITFFTPLYFEFESKTVPGWGKITIIGDTTTGKSETVKQAIRLLESGQIISGETTSIAGLGATATQSTNNQWFVEYGPLVLQDRKLLAIDGAHKLRSEHWSSLAESEREGKIKLTKAAKGEALARTRQIKIMNPKGPDFSTVVTMKDKFYPCQAIQNNLQIHSIARQDLAVFVNDDVKAEELNKKYDVLHDKRLEYLSDLVKLVWKQDYNIVFEDEAIDTILENATALQNKFKFDQIPLITNDQKYKLAKLAASIAAVSCSYNDDFSILTVKKEHVEYVVDFVNTEYHNAGLDVKADEAKDEGVDADLVDELIAKMKSALDREDPMPSNEICKKVLLWIAQKTSFTKDELGSEFNLSRDHGLRPLSTLLKNEGIIQHKQAFRPTRKGIEIGKFLKNSGQLTLN